MNAPLDYPQAIPLAMLLVPIGFFAPGGDPAPTPPVTAITYDGDPLVYGALIFTYTASP
jgi:hypothetical protein